MPDHASSDEAPFFLSLSYAIYTAGPVRGDEQRANNRGSLAFIAKSQASPRGAIRKPITFKLYLTLRWRPPWACSCCLYYFHSLLISARHLCHLLQRRNIFTHPISEALLLFSRSPKALRIATGFSKKTSGLRSVFSPAIWLNRNTSRSCLYFHDSDLLFAGPESMQFIKLHWSAQCGAAQDLLQYWQPFSWRCGDGKCDNSDYSALAAEA